MSYLFGKLCDQGISWHWKNDVRSWFKAARNFFFTPDSNRTLIWHCLIWRGIHKKQNHYTIRWASVQAMQWAWILLTSWLLMFTTTWWRPLPLLARLWKHLVLLWSLCWSSMVNIANFRNVQPDHFATSTTLTTSCTCKPQPRTTNCKQKC